MSDLDRITELEKMLDAAIDERDKVAGELTTVRLERDQALQKIAAAGEIISRELDSERLIYSNREQGLREIRDALGICPICGVYARLADRPCTHLGSNG